MGVFSEALLRLRQDIDQSHENRRKLIEDIRAEVRQMARQTGNLLAEQGRNRQTQFTAMLKDLRGAVKAGADQTRTQLAELAADLHHGGESFKARKTGRLHGANR